MAYLASLDKEEQAALIDDLQRKNIYPISFRILKALNSSNFGTLESGGFRYTRFTYTPTTSIAVVGLNVGLVENGATTARYGVIVSFTTSVVVTDNGSATAPDDQGNHIYCGFSLAATFNDYVRYSPYVYYVPANIPIYVYFLADNSVMPSGNTLQGYVILHTLQTGVRN